MTDIADAPTGARAESTKSITHWIGGRRVPGSSGRTGPVYDPATGVQTGAVDLASVEEVDAAVRSAKAAFAVLARGVPGDAARSCSSASASCSTRIATSSRGS